MVIGQILTLFLQRKNQLVERCHVDYYSLMFLRTLRIQLLLTGILSVSQNFSRSVEDCPKTRLVNKIETIADIIIIVNNAILKKYFFLVFCKPITNNILQ